MKIERRLSTADRPVAEQVEWKTVDTTGAGGFAMAGVEVPARWSQDAANILASKYFRKAGVPLGALTGVEEHGMPSWLWRWQADPGVPTGSETSARQVFHRMAGCWTYWGWCEGLLTTDEDALAFYDEIYLMMANQIAAPNSPQFFNTGLHWAYGIEGPDSGMWRVSNSFPRDCAAALVEAKRVHNTYENPQPHACFIQPVADDLVNPGGMMDLWTREARLFKQGSGSGSNLSSIRGKGERLSGGGVSSGLMSFLEVGDRSAGSIQSGGTTRRAALMRCLDLDHPEIEDFNRWKIREEAKAAAMYVGSRLIAEHAADDEALRRFNVPEAVIDRIKEGFEQEIFGIGWEGEEEIRTVSGQNSNNSDRVTDEFFRLVDADEPWHLTSRTTGEVIKTVSARNLWRQICRSAWASADPGVQFHDTINAWHTCATDGPINASNPCSEYMFLDNTACNLASMRLTAFRRHDGLLNLDLYEHAIRLWTIVLEISIEMASFPSSEIAVGSYNYRTLGLGYADAGGLLRRRGLAYDSDDGRTLIAGLTALMTGVAYRTSAAMATEVGPFPRWGANAEWMKRVLRNHARAARVDTLLIEGASDDPRSYEDLNILPQPLDREFLDKDLRRRIDHAWTDVCAAESFRNAQVSLIAPTGTISFVMDCSTTGIEPYYSRAAVKNLAGGGTMSIENDVLDEDCAMPSREGGPCLRPMAHVLMVASVQPFLSGAASKTANMPRSATVEDVDNLYREAHRLGLKSVALYRDGCKLAQPLNVVRPLIIEEPMSEVGSSPSPESDSRHRGPEMGVNRDITSRRRIPARAKGYRQKIKVDGHTVYLHTGEYDDGTLGEVFVEMSNEGSTVRAMVNAFAKAVSIARQYGAPLDVLVDAFVGTKFEPAGIVEGHDRIKMATSVFDAVFRDLAIHYLGREEHANVVRTITGRPELDGLLKEAITAFSGMSQEDQERLLELQRESFVRGNVAIDRDERTAGMTRRMLRSAEICPACHEPTLVRTGTCRACRNSACDYSEGCG